MISSTKYQHQIRISVQ